MGTELRVVIVGGGVGGLATALALGRRGVACVVLEQAPELRFGGFGLMVQPNALTALDAIGAARPNGRALTEMRVMTASGATLSRLRSPADRAPLGVPRSALLDALRDAVERSAPDVSLRTGARVVAIDADADGARVRLADGETLEGDVVIGADGLHSVVRAALFGASPPRYAGYTVWRGLARGPGLDTSGAREIWGRGKRFGLVPLDDELVYWFAVANTPAGIADGPDPLREMRARFDGWGDAVARALAATAPTELARHDCYDRPPSRDWGRGRFTLLGDAAHAMTPNMGQGACQTLEDAAVLGPLLGAVGPAEAPRALRAYEDARRGRAARFVNRSWSFGRLGQRQNAVACALRNTAVRLVPSALTGRMMRAAWRFAPPPEPAPLSAEPPA